MIRFGLTTDSHYADREPAKTRYYRDVTHKMEDFVAKMNKEQVDFIIHLGDFKDEGIDQRKADTIQYLQTLEEIFNQFKGSTYHCVGNHDLDSITKEVFLANINNTSIPNTKSYYSFDLKGWHFIVLDANYTPEGENHFMRIDETFWERPNIPEKELKWLEKDLNSTNYPCVIFCHHPLFEVYHGRYSMFVRNYEQVQNVLQESGKVKACLHGHIHMEMQKEIYGINYFCFDAMVDYPFPENAFYLVELDENEIKIERSEKKSN